MSSTKNRVVIIQNVIILTYLLACYIGPDRPWAVIVAGKGGSVPRAAAKAVGDRCFITTGMCGIDQGRTVMPLTALTAVITT